MSQRNEFGVFFNNEQRKEILRGVFAGYYKDIHPKKVVFDTNRFWCSRMALVAGLFPNAKVIATVRHLPWIMDSVERLMRRNTFETSRIFNYDPGGTVYSRVEALSSGAGLGGLRLEFAQGSLLQRRGRPSDAHQVRDADARAREGDQRGL